MAQHYLSIFITIVTSASVTAVSASTLRSKESTCECKNWMETYKSGAIACGTGSEFYFHTHKMQPLEDTMTTAKAKWGKMVCTDFYEKLNTNKCVNVNMGQDYGQWCYVDAACEDLNKGDKISNSQLSWKMCQTGKDASLRDSHPEELAQFSKDNDVWLAMLHKMSYPGERAGEGGAHLWKTVMASFGISPEVGAWVENYSPEGMPNNLKADAELIKSKGIPHSFDTRTDGKVPHMIVDGEKVYIVEGGENPITSPGGWSTLRCVGGC